MMKREKKQLIRKDAIELLKQGTSRQETFNILVEKYKYTTDVADVIKQLPSAVANKKFGKYNNILLGIMLFTAAYILFLAPSVAEFLIWYGLLIYFVATKRTEYYMWISIVSIFFYIASFAILFFSSNEATNLLDITILLVLQSPNLFMPFWLERKLCPKPIEKRELYLDHYGRQKIKIAYEFSDI